MMMKSRQRGAFLMARALLIVGILTAMLVIPVYLKKEREEREAAVHKAELAHSQGSGAAPLAASGVHSDVAPAARAIGHGLTFVVIHDDGKAPPEVVRLSCHGEPATLDQPHQGSCNPYRGDTSCRTVLPVLCVCPAAAPLPAGLDAGAYPGWTGGTLGATQPGPKNRIDAQPNGTANIGGPGVGPLRKGTGPGLADGCVSRRPGRPRQLGASGSSGSRPDRPYPLLGPYRRPEGQLLGQRRVAVDGFT